MTTLVETGAALRRAYVSAPKGDATLRVRLFAIRYAEQIASHGVADVVAAAGLPKSYGTEIHKGLRLAAFVEIRRDRPLDW